MTAHSDTGNGIEEVASGIYRIEAPVQGMPQPPIFYLIDAPEGVLIEPGPASVLPYIQDAASRLGMAGLSYIIPTHMHVDHGGGAGAAAMAFPMARVVVHPRGAKHLLSPDRLVESTALVWGSDFEKRLGPILPVPESRLVVAGDGERLTLGDRQLEIIHAVGHSSNHIVILDHKVNGLFCGEALGLPRNLLPPVAPYSFEQDIYIDTIQSLKKLRVDRLFYSHGSVESDPPGCVARALENARIYSAMVLESALKGASLEEIMEQVDQDFALRYGWHLSRAELEISVPGYVIYYQTKGTLPGTPVIG